MQGVILILFIGRVHTRRKSVLEKLEKQYGLTTTTSGRGGLVLAGGLAPRLVILDAVSLRTPGSRMCQRLRQRLVHTPILHIHPGTKRRVQSAADSVLFEPLSDRSLLLAVERLLKLDENDLTTCGPFSLNMSARTLVAHGHEVQLNPKVATLLAFFLRHPNETLDRKTLMKAVWDTDYVGDTRTLDVHIRWVRLAIELDPGKPVYLRTVRGVGYRMAITDTGGE